VRRQNLALLALLRDFLPAKVRGDFTELLEGRFEVFDDFLSENVGIGKVVGVFET